MEKYFNNKKLSKNENLNIFMQQIYFKQTNFNEDFIFNELVNVLQEENQFNFESLKKFKIMLYDYYQPEFVEMNLKALFSKLPFTRIQSWTIDKDGLKINDKPISFSFSYIILFHCTTYSEFRSICQLFKTRWDINTILNDGFLLKHIEPQLLINNWSLICENFNVKFCSCDIINGFTQQNCCSVNCINKSSGMRHVNINETVFSVTLCKKHINDLSQPIKIKCYANCA